MLAVIHEVENKDLFEYVGIDSFLSLPLLTTTIEKAVLSELNYISIDHVFYYKRKGKCDHTGKEYDTQTLVENLLKYNDDKIFLIGNNIYFELDEAFKSINKLSISCVAISDQNNKVCGYVLNKDFFIDILTNSKCNDLNCFLESLPNITRIIDVTYFSQIETLKDYKKFLIDIINNKTKIILPTVAEKIFSTGKIPEGDFIVVPPVFIGEGVQIENDCIIGPNSVICDNTLVSRNSHIKSSVLMRDNYISSGCFIENTLCCEGVSVLRNSAVFSGSILGRFSSVSEETFLENNSKLRPFVKTGDYFPSVHSKRGCFTFSGCSPEYTAMIGGALGTLFKEGRFAILTDGEVNSIALKYALLSGFISTGVHAFELGKGYASMLTFYLNYFDIDYGVYIKGGKQGTLINVINKSGEHISVDSLISVKDIIKRNMFERVDERHCYKSRKLNGLRQLYVKNIVKMFEENLQILPIFNCENKNVKEVVEEIIDDVGCSNCRDQIFFDINDDATSVVCRIKDVVIAKNKLLDFVAFYGFSVDSQIAFNRQCDAVFLCFEVLNILSSGELDFYTEINNLPSFFVAEKTFETNVKIPTIASKLSERFNVGFRENNLVLSNDNVKLKIINNCKNNFCIVAHSKKFEVSEEIVGDVIKLLTGL